MNIELCAGCIGNDHSCYIRQWKYYANGRIGYENIFNRTIYEILSHRYSSPFGDEDNIWFEAALHILDKDKYDKLMIAKMLR